MKSCPDCNATYPDDYAICPKDGAPLQEATLWQIGTVVRGKYRILAHLGEGGMAMVYKAHHELLDELRALKVIKPDLARDAEFMGRFKNEAIMARKLSHPNAVRVDDLDIAEDGLPFIAMELVVGDTLKTMIQRFGALPVSLVLDISAHICDALESAHKLGLVHRDIKPENIVLVSQREGPPIAKILDFGISRLREETAGAKGLTQTGMVIGTPEYMSPEQAMGKRGQQIDGRSDLYSLGIVMYRMLTGELPFQAETTVEIILQHLKTPAKPPHMVKPELAIPEVVSAVVMKALEKDREKRFANAAEMSAAIRKARGSPTMAARKIEWGSLSTARASFGTESNEPVGPVAAAVAPARPGASSASAAATPAATSGAAAPAERSPYRSSARIGPPPKEFPTRMVMTLVWAALLVVGIFLGWKYFGSWLTPKKPAVPAATVPAKPPTVSTAGGEKPAAPPDTSTPGSKKPVPHKTLSYSEQAKVIELNSLAGIYYKQGGCEKALPVYEQALEIDPANPVAYAAVQRCFAKVKNAPPLPLIPDNSNHP